MMTKLYVNDEITRFDGTFLKSVGKDGFFDTPFDLFKEKKISCHRRDNEPF